MHAKTFRKSANIFFEIRADFASPFFSLPILQISCGYSILLLKNGCFYTALSSISILRNGDFYVGSTLTAIFPYTHPDTNRAAEVLAFIMAATRALLAGENAHPRGQIGSLKTHRRVQILQVRL